MVGAARRRAAVGPTGWMFGVAGKVQAAPQTDDAGFNYMFAGACLFFVLCIALVLGNHRHAGRCMTLDGSTTTTTGCPAPLQTRRRGPIC